MHSEVFLWTQLKGSLSVKCDNLHAEQTCFNELCKEIIVFCYVFFNVRSALWNLWHAQCCDARYINKWNIMAQTKYCSFSAIGIKGNLHKKIIIAKPGMSCREKKKNKVQTLWHVNDFKYREHVSIGQSKTVANKTWHFLFGKFYTFQSWKKSVSHKKGGKCNLKALLIHCCQYQC